MNLDELLTTAIANRAAEQPPLKVGDREFPYDVDVHGWTIKTTTTHKISVCILLYHFRIAMTPHQHPHSWDHGWCYSGNENDLLHAVVAAVTWDPDTEAEPFGWSKRACHCVREIS